MRKPFKISQIAILFLLFLTIVSCRMKSQKYQSEKTQVYLDSLETMFENVPDWLATVYDEQSGGFYHNALMVSDTLFGPDLQSTTMALSILLNGNIAKMDTVPNAFKSKLKNFVISRYDTARGFFTDPIYYEKLLQSERNLARAQGAATGILSKIGVSDFVVPPLKTDEIPYYLQSLDSFKKWLGNRKWDRVWTAFDHIAMQSGLLKRVPPERADSIVQYIQNYVEGIQDKDGLWGKGQAMEVRFSGAAKYGTFCMNQDLPMPAADTMYHTVLQWFRDNKQLDFGEHSSCPICVPRNALRLLYYLKPHLSFEIPESDKTILVESTYRMLKFYKGTDGGFMKHHEKSAIAPLDLYYGEYDALVSDINGTHLAVTARKALYDLLEKPVPVIKMNVGIFESAKTQNTIAPVLHQKINIPNELCTTTHDLKYGGDIRVGDLQNKREAAFLVYRAAIYQDGGACQPCFMGAFTAEGKVLWKKGEGGFQPNRPGPVAIHDINADGKTEVITLFAEKPESAEPHSMKNISVQILNGKTGELIKEASPKELTSSGGKGPNWVHQRIFICNLLGNSTPQDFIIKLGTKLIAFNHDLKVLWTYENAWDEYQNCPAYIPSIGDMDNDGLDEINGGYYILDAKGKPIWEKKLGKNMDSVSIDFWDSQTEKRSFASGLGYVLDKQGNVILKLGEELVPHGQELRVADFDKTLPGNEMLIRYNGHNEQVMLIGNKGEVLQRFELNSSPNNTGMENIFWNGKNEEAMLFNGGMLWKGDGSLSFNLPGLPPEKGHKRQGWYHCIPANIAGDEREEAIVYNPWDSEIFIFTQQSSNPEIFKGYFPTPRQYNARLMD